MVSIVYRPLEAGEFEAAIREFDRAIGIDEKHALAWRDRGRGFAALGVNQYFGWNPGVGPLRELGP
jgi:Tfp pilus assembly protein PilF